MWVLSSFPLYFSDIEWKIIKVTWFGVVNLFNFLNFYFYFILLYNTVLVLPYIDMNPPRVYMSSQTWTRLPPPSPYHLSGSSQCTSPQASCILYQTYTGDSFLIWYYICFNAILPNHPTLSLSHRVQKTVLYICVFFAVSHTGLSLPSF